MQRTARGYGVVREPRQRRLQLGSFAPPPAELPRTPPDEAVLSVGEGGRYRLYERVGRGSFGLIYRGYDERATRQSDRWVAVKLEPQDAPHPQLEYEYRVYRLLHSGGSPWLPRLRWYGTQDEYNVLVMELLGPSLQRLLDAQPRGLPADYVMLLAPKMLQRIEYAHSLGLLHRDIKPDNFVVGADDAHSVYLIDFGLAKRYRDEESGDHIPYREGKRLTGTARYASVNVHLGLEQARRDDCEALAYVLVYLCRGALPWQGERGATRSQRNRAIGLRKQRVATARLCRGLPPAFEELVLYTRSLKFKEEPDYAYMRGLFVAADGSASSAASE